MTLKLQLRHDKSERKMMKGKLKKSIEQVEFEIVLTQVQTADFQVA